MVKEFCRCCVFCSGVDTATAFPTPRRPKLQVKCDFTPRFALIININNRTQFKIRLAFLNRRASWITKAATVIGRGHM